MKNKAKLRLYIRRIHPGDRADDIRTAIRLGMADTMGYHYAIVQRGFPHRVFEVGPSKLDLKRRCTYFWKRRKEGRK